LWVKATYKAGERDGAYEVYRENGQLEESGMYRAGQRVGSEMQLQRN
jgi:antitoxin component YwqK of YwqJK toxin-antitoxin module